MAELVRLGATEGAGTICEALAEEGVVVVEDLLGADDLAQRNRDLDPLLGATTPDHEGNFINDTVAWFFGARTRHVTGIVGKVPAFAEVVTHPLYDAACRAVLLDHCASYQLNLAHVLDRGPGAERQVLHRDQQVWQHLFDLVTTVPQPVLQLASMVALVDFTEANGATLVVPGSHRWDPARAPRDDELVAAEMAAGSCALYLGSTIHAAGANTTAQWRRGLHVSFCAGWLRTEENQVLATPKEVARRLPARAQRVLGYGAHDAIEVGGGYVGTVELQDPVELLATGGL